MQLIRLLKPKGLFTWIGFVLLATALVAEIGPQLRNPAGMIAGGVVLVGAVLLFWKLPSRWQEFGWTAVTSSAVWSTVSFCMSSL